MSLARYDDYIAYARQHFEEGLIRSGFVETETGWRGPITHSNDMTQVLITLPVQFPFYPPKVVPVDDDAVPWSWHRDLNGALCLVAEDDHEGLWWTDAPAFLEHVTAWFEQADNGWPGDRPDLDLDRYFHPSEDARLYLYDDLAQYGNGFVRFRQAKNNTMRVGRGTPTTRPAKNTRHRFGYVADLGHIDAPPRTWADISARINPNINLERRIRRFEITVVVLTYRRGVHDGAIVLEVWPTKGGDIASRRLTSAADTEAARSARAGVLAPELQRRRVAVVGIGALGSFITDMLARSGVGHLTLVDHDVVLPGNIIRHLVGPDAVGLRKVDAVKRHITERNTLQSTEIAVIGDPLTSGAEAAELLGTHDLVVNATADFATTAMLHITAEALGTHILSAALQNDGNTYRIDVLPPLRDADPLPPSTSCTDHVDPRVLESGCGSPISPAPPHAVVEAGAATVRHAVRLLVNRPLHPAGETHDLAYVPERRQQ